MKNNAIFLTFDDGYQLLGMACIQSIKYRYPEHPVILVLFTGQDEGTICSLKKIDNVILLDEKKYLFSADGFSSGPVGSPAVYNRYILWSDLFPEYDDILYLDSDVLVLLPLDDIFKHDDFFSVANNCSYYTVRIFKPEYENDERLHKLLNSYHIEYPYEPNDMINSGVMVIPKKYRNEENFNQLINITRDFSEFLGFEDQSAISLWMKIHGIQPYFDYEYNYQTAFLFKNENENILNEIHILHFSTHKPFTSDFRRWDFVQGRTKQLEQLFASFVVLPKKESEESNLPTVADLLI
jgi:lipopolysaccharide biosynthesis glycosyltransferase